MINFPWNKQNSKISLLFLFVINFKYKKGVQDGKALL